MSRRIVHEPERATNVPAEDRDKWDARYRMEGARDREPANFLLECDHLLPRQGRALDVAGGTGRNAVWLARRGLEVTIADISGVALEIAREQAATESLPLHIVAVDLEAEPVPAGPWDLIVCVHFLWRPLFAAFASALAPGGMLVVAHPTRSNLERHASPGPRYLLDDGELQGLATGLEIVVSNEGWTKAGRHEAHLLARRPTKLRSKAHSSTKQTEAYEK